MYNKQLASLFVVIIAIVFSVVVACTVVILQTSIIPDTNTEVNNDESYDRSGNE